MTLEIQSTRQTPELQERLHSLATVGLVVNRVEMRRLLKQLDKLGEDVPKGCIYMRSQLRSALARRGWKRMAISAPAAPLRYAIPA